MAREDEASYHASVVLLITTLGSLALWRILHRVAFFSPLRTIPCVKTDWQTWAFRWIYEEPSPPQLLEWANNTPNSGLLRYYGIGGTTRLLLTSPEAVKEVMILKRYDAYARPASGTQTIELLFGHGLLTSEGDAHRQQKRALAPAFTSRAISALHPVFWSKACELVRRLGDEISEKSPRDNVSDVELIEWASRAALDIIGVAVWGKDFNALARPHSDFVTRYERIFRPGTPRSQRQAKWIYAASHLVPMQWLAKYFPCEFFREKSSGARAIRQAVKSAVGERRAVLASGDSSHKDVLSGTMALEAFEDHALQGQMMNFLSAGHGTTSLTVTWLSYFLAQNPDVQRRLREEVRSGLPSPAGEEGSSAVAGDVSSLPYLRDCIRETLRVMPIIHTLRRQTMKDTTILDRPIPAGTSVVCSPWVSAMLQAVWGADAGAFDPDRWSRIRDQQESTANSYIPFSCGPRTCIGESFAKAEVAALVAALVGSFELQLADAGRTPDVIWGVSATPIGLRVRMRRLAGW